MDLEETEGLRMTMIAEHKFRDMERRNTNISKILSLANNGAKWERYSELANARLARFCKK